MFITGFFMVVSFTLANAVNNDRFFWKPQYNGLFTLVLEIRLLYALTKQYHKTLIIEGFIHRQSQHLNVCALFDLKDVSITCAEEVPSSVTCSASLTDIMLQSGVDICLEGNTVLTQPLQTDSGFLHALQIDLPLRLHGSKLTHLPDVRQVLGLRSDPSNFTVVHWRGFGRGAECSTADCLSSTIRRHTNDTIIYIASSQPHNSELNETFLSANGFSSSHSVLRDRYPHLDSLSRFAIDVTLMLTASTYLSVGSDTEGSGDIDDVIESERRKVGRSFCTLGTGRFCHSLTVGGVKGKAKAQSNETAEAINARNSAMVAQLRNLTDTNNIPLVKTATSVHTRLLFIAGLEGTGHHAFHAMFRVCARSKRCEPEGAISRSSMHYNNRTQEMHGLFGAADGAKTLHHMNNILVAMRRLAAAPGDHLYSLGLNFVKHSGMMSYPNYNGKHKSLDHPDAYALALLAESAGLDFRVLVLQRSAAEIIASTAKRGFGGALRGVGQLKILVDNAAALYSQLVLLDRAFYHCVQYSELGSLTARQRAALVDFLHPAHMRGEMEVMLKEIRYTNSSNSDSNDSNSNDGVHGIGENPTGPQGINGTAITANTTTVTITGNAGRSDDGTASQVSPSLVVVRPNAKRPMEVDPVITNYFVLLLEKRLELISSLCDKQ